jgi:hypothetical protein
MSAAADRMFRQVAVLRWTAIGLMLFDFLYSLVLLWEVISHPEQVWFYRIAFGAILRAMAPALLGFMVLAERSWAALGFAGFKLFMLVLLGTSVAGHTAVGATFDATPFVLMGLWHTLCMATVSVYFIQSRRLEEFLRYDFEDTIVKTAHPKDLIARKYR